MHFRLGDGNQLVCRVVVGQICLDAPLVHDVFQDLHGRCGVCVPQRIQRNRRLGVFLSHFGNGADHFFDPLVLGRRGDGDNGIVPRVHRQLNCVIVLEQYVQRTVDHGYITDFDTVDPQCGPLSIGIVAVHLVDRGLDLQMILRHGADHQSLLVCVHCQRCRGHERQKNLVSRLWVRVTEPVDVCRHLGRISRHFLDGSGDHLMIGGACPDDQTPWIG